MFRYVLLYFAMLPDYFLNIKYLLENQMEHLEFWSSWIFIVGLGNFIVVVIRISEP